MTHTTISKTIRSMFGQNRQLVVHRTFIDWTGSVEGALFLGQLLYWSDITTDEEGWFYKTTQEWEAEISLTEYAIKKFSAQFVAAGFLRVKLKQVRGAPVTHYLLDEDALFSWGQSVSHLDSSKTRNPIPRKHGMDSAKCGDPNLQNTESTSLSLDDSLDDIQSAPSPLVENLSEKPHASAPVEELEYAPVDEADDAVSRQAIYQLRQKERDRAFRKQVRERAKQIKRGIKAEIPPAPPVSARRTTPVRPPDPPPPLAVDFPSRWNALVPERPVDAGLFTERQPAYADPLFQQRFDEICGKFRSLIQRGAKVTYLGMFKRDKETGVPWWKMVLAGDLEWLVGERMRISKDNLPDDEAAPTTPKPPAVPLKVDEIDFLRPDVSLCQ